MACRSCICTYPQLKEVVTGALMEHRVLQKQRGSVGAGSCAESGSNLDLILQLLIVASHIFFTYKVEARTQQEKAQDFLLGRMLYLLGLWFPGPLHSLLHRAPRMERLCKVAEAASGTGRVHLLLPRVPWHRSNAHAPWEEWWLPAWLFSSLCPSSLLGSRTS